MDSVSGCEFVRRQVYGRIQKWRESGDDSACKAELANLRRGLGYLPGDIPELWGSLFGAVYDNPDKCRFFSKDGTPTREEWAIYLALTLFALHQQSKDIHTECMNVEKQGLGRAVRWLVHNDDDEERVRHRFNSVATAQDISSLAYHLRSLIQLLSADKIGLDYPQLAADIYRYQNTVQRPRVRLQWGRDFYYKSKTEESQEK